MLVELYKDEEVHIITLDFPAMIRVGEQISILRDEYYQYYKVKKIWYRVEYDVETCFACAEVIIDE